MQRGSEVIMKIFLIKTGRSWCSLSFELLAGLLLLEWRFFFPIAKD